MQESGGALKQFLEESFDHVDKFEEQLLALESGNLNPEQAYAEMFRSLHSIKGAVGLFKFMQLEQISHEAEDILNLIQNKELEITTGIISDLFKTADYIKAHLSHIQSNGSENPLLMSNLKGLKSKLLEYKSSAKLSETPVKLSKARKMSPAQIKALQALGEAGKAYLEPADIGTVAVNPSAEMIKIGPGIFTNLEDISKELVFLRNRLFKDAKQEAHITEDLLDLDRSVNALKALVFEISLEPFSTITQQLQRAVRDLAQRLNKKISITISGEETKMDKRILKKLYDPMLHMIRNAVDHGLETALERASSSKSEEGRIAVKVKQQGDFVFITLSDDGRGMDLNKIKAKALALNIVSEESLAVMTKKEVLDLIFAPGFSTKEEINSISGRGVGMDVVRSNILKVNGSISISSRMNKGTLIKMKIPSSVSFTKILKVKVADNQLAIPQASILGFASLDLLDKSQKAVPYKGFDIPLIYADDFFSCLDYGSGQSYSVVNDRKFRNYLIISADAYVYALVVDDILDDEEVVIRSLDYELPYYSGSAILDDGKAALVMEMSSIAQYYNLVRDSELNKALDLANAEFSKKLDIPVPVVVTKSKMEKLALSFEIGEQLYAISLDDIDELIPYETSDSKYPLTRIPGAQDGIRGIVNIRGNMLSSKSLFKALGAEKLNSVFSAVLNIAGTKLSCPLPNLGDLIDLNQAELSSDRSILSPEQDLLVGQILELSSKRKLFLLNCQACIN